MISNWCKGKKHPYEYLINPKVTIIEFPIKIDVDAVENERYVGADVLSQGSLPINDILSTSLPQDYNLLKAIFAAKILFLFKLFTTKTLSNFSFTEIETDHPRNAFALNSGLTRRNTDTSCFLCLKRFIFVESEIK